MSGTQLLGVNKTSKMYMKRNKNSLMMMGILDARQDFAL